MKEVLYRAKDTDTTTTLSVDTGQFPQTYNSIILRRTIGRSHHQFYGVRDMSYCMDVLGFAVKHIPTPIASRLSSSGIGDLFNLARSLTTTTEPVVISAPHGSVVVQAPASSTFHQIVEEEGRYEYPFVEDLSRNLETSDVFYDIGAQFGVFGIIAMEAGVDPEHIHAFEKDSFAAPIAKKNLGDKTHVIQKLVGDGDGSVTIDKYATERDPPTVVKIDVEGAEGRVLEGMERTLDSISVAYVEVHPQFLPQFGDDPQTVFEQLETFSLSILEDHRDEGEVWRSLEEADPPDETAYLIRASADR